MCVCVCVCVCVYIYIERERDTIIHYIYYRILRISVTTLAPIALRDKYTMAASQYDLADDEEDFDMDDE